MKWLEWYCGECDRILAEVNIVDGLVKKICDKCGTINVFEVKVPVSYNDLLRHLLNMQAQGTQTNESMNKEGE